MILMLLCHMDEEKWETGLAEVPSAMQLYLSCWKKYRVAPTDPYRLQVRIMLLGMKKWDPLIFISKNRQTWHLVQNSASFQSQFKTISKLLAIKLEKIIQEPGWCLNKISRVQRLLLILCAAFFCFCCYPNKIMLNKVIGIWVLIHVFSFFRTVLFVRICTVLE